VNVHAALEGLVDRWQLWRDRRFRARLRRFNRRNRTIYVGKRPDPNCIVHNEPKPRS
jgi:hypothetical protein